MGGGSRQMLDIERWHKMVAFIEQNDGATVGELS